MKRMLTLAVCLGLASTMAAQAQGKEKDGKKRGRGVAKVAKQEAKIAARPNRGKESRRPSRAPGSSIARHRECETTSWPPAESGSESQAFGRTGRALRGASSGRCAREPRQFASRRSKVGLSTARDQSDRGLVVTRAIDGPTLAALGLT